MKLSDFDYNLPEELIAQSPLADRSSSRMMILDRSTSEIDHRIFRQLPDLLESGDCIVINNTKVIPARLLGRLENSQTPAELLLLKRIDANRWETKVSPGKKLREGSRAVFGEKLFAEIEAILDDGNRIVKFEYEGVFEELLLELGEMPLPPYIKERLEDDNRYQTVYAKHEGSAAAPTAGLHFTNEVFSALKTKGVNIAELTLHVGLGTFRPVKTDDIKNHHMHNEFYHIDKENCDIINETKRAGKKIIAIGTTSVRTLESACDADGLLAPSSGDTGIFIYPGFNFRCIDGLLTNFHLPKSTLLMLISALAGRDRILSAYEEAVKKKYRFFSFGDAMLIL